MEAILVIIIVLALVLCLGPVCFLLLSPVFSLLNQLQWILQRPWRWLARKPSRANCAIYFMSFPIRSMLQAALYILATPLRVANAVYYNLLVYNLWNFRDQVFELFIPKRGHYRDRRKSAYLFAWLVGLPKRFLICILQICLSIVDSVAMTIVDTVFPTLTMYHGTSFDAAVSINQSGWLIGDGNFAGTGLYFAMSREAATHYSHGHKSACIVCVRLTLGMNYPLSCAPQKIRAAIRSDGNHITSWGQKWRVASTEHWRDDGPWWEYCLLRFPEKTTIKTWRVRPLYVVPERRVFPTRIWGGSYVWVLQPSAWIPIITSAAILVVLIVVSGS